MSSEKTRILYIATFPPPVHGSSVVSMQIKESKLINDEFDGDYVNLGTSRKMDEIGKGGVILILTKLMRFIGSYLSTFWLLLTHRYDLCYCAITINGKGFLKDAPYVLLCHLFGRNVVIHQHNKGMSRFVDKPLYRWLYKHVYKNTKVILLSEYLYDDISAIVDRKDVMICPNGIKPSEIRAESLEFKEDKKEVPHILFLSNLIESKGCLVLLDACKLLKEKGISFCCDFVGGDTKEISADRFNKEIADRGLPDNVIYHGRKYGNDKNEFWAKADVFAFPTYYYNETFGLVNLEAMDHSIPVISTNEGGIPDIVDDGVTGFIIPPQDPKALADAIEKLLLNPDLRHQMGLAGRKKFKEKFTEERFERKMMECLEKGMGEINTLSLKNI